VKTQEKTRHPLENLVGIFLSINPERAPQAIPAVLQTFTQ